MSRWKASLIHLILSATIATTVLVLMLLLWYAPPFFSSAGGHHVLLIMLGVDVTLGPFITLIIFNIQKSRRALVFDLSVIAILQISALIYGTSVMFHARPVFAVFSKDSFDLVTANMLSDEDIAKAKYPAYRSLPFAGPVYVYSEMPTGVKERNEVVMSAFSGKDLPQYPQYYQPYAEHVRAVADAAKPIAELKKKNPDHIAEIDAAVNASGQTEQDIGFVALRAKYQDMAMIISKRNGSVLTSLPLNPW